MKTIKDIIAAEFPGEILYENKIREKIREIIGLCGLDENLFRINNKFQFPDESVSFIANIIKEYTSEEIKALRKESGIIWGVKDDKIESLFQGFSTCLQGLLLDENVLKQQIYNMDVKLLYSYRKSRRRLKSAIEGLSKYSFSFAKNYYNNHLLYGDLVSLTDFIATNIEELHNNMENIYSYMDDNRSGTVYEGADNTSEEINKKILEFDYKAGLVSEKLNENEKYIELRKQLRDMSKDLKKENHSICELRKSRKEFSAIMAKMAQIRKETEIELFGHELQKVDIPTNLKFDNPIAVLADAVQQTAEDNLCETGIKHRTPLPQDEVNDIMEIVEKVTGKKTPSISPLYLENKK